MAVEPSSGHEIEVLQALCTLLMGLNQENRKFKIGLQCEEEPQVKKKKTDVVYSLFF